MFLEHDLTGKGREKFERVLIRGRERDVLLNRLRHTITSLCQSDETHDKKCLEHLFLDVAVRMVKRIFFF